MTPMTPVSTFEFLDKYNYKGKFIYFTYMEGDQFSYTPLLLKLGEDFPEWELVQVFQRVEIRQNTSKVHTIGNDGNNAGAQAIQIFTPFFKTEVKNYENLPDNIKDSVCINLDIIRKQST